MNDPFVQSEWERLCDHLRTCASAIADGPNQRDRFTREASEFAEQQPPSRYQQLLDLTAAASHLAVKWQNAHREELIDETLDESFPASDPPSFSHSHA